ncbi:MAG TPA: DNA replication complex GINS family protein [Candidatus Methanomethylia archaeon]|nr:DNA replication complex GINS family protein [Candidatus Verstraetearchaeota archaeon]HDI46780.1 DNA replication complex GINS family protein [Candidatus Methanomethylicia archaeon]
MSLEIRDAVKFQDFMFEELAVPVVFIKECPIFSISGEELGPFEAGQEAELPLWAAQVLEKEGYVEVKKTPELTLQELSKAVWKEERSDTLFPIPLDFYARLRRYLQALKRKVRESPSPDILHELRMAETKAQDLVSCRIQKVIRLALEKEAHPKIVESMAFEERILFNEVHQLVEAWRNTILRSP